MGACCVFKYIEAHQVQPRQGCMVDICNEVAEEGLRFTIMGDPGMFGGDDGALFGVPGFVNFMGVYLLVPFQGYGVHLCATVDLHGYALYAILCGKQWVGVEYDLAIQYTFC